MAALDPDTYVSISTISKHFGVSEYPIRDRIRSGELPAIKMGGGRTSVIRVKVSDVQKLFAPVVAKAPRRRHPLAKRESADPEPVEQSLEGSIRKLASARITAANRAARTAGAPT